jgi:NAD(P)H-dependent FMN reductase
MGSFVAIYIKIGCPGDPHVTTKAATLALLLETSASLLAAARISLADCGACRERRSTDYPKELVMETGRPLFIPVILGTARMGRMSLHAAQLVTGELGKCAGIETDLIDIAKIPLPTNDAGEAIKQADFSAKMNKADALVVVSPEYNHGYSGLLKHVLDSCLKEYIHKAVGIVGVSAGPFGGTRVIQNLLPVMREIGLVTIFWDVNFSSVQKVFAEDGRLLDESYIRRIDKFLKELIWMAKTLRQGREQISLG